MRIGLFDSGLGGLTILKSVAATLPQYDYVYWGDTAHVPYGDRSEEEIYELTREGVRELFERDCLIVILACNTASAETLRRLQDTFLVTEYPDRRLLGVIIPTVETVVEAGLDNVLLVATKRTVESGKYERELAKFPQVPALTAVATPGLVPKIEAGDLDGALALLSPVIDTYLGAGEAGSQGMILGCTHYTTLSPLLQERYPTLRIIAQTDVIPSKLAAYLAAHPELETQLSRTATRSIHFTKQDATYDRVIERLLGGILVVEG